MMERMTYTQEDQRQRRRRGQTLAEFSLTLPILLILLFGIIEFARIFQAWVTLENATRTAARYASTGVYNESRFNIESIVPCDPISETEEPITRDLRGDYQVATIPFGNSSVGVNMYTPGTVGIDAPDFEDLFGTWYSGIDCEGGVIEHQQLRTDLMRLFSIYEEARRGAAGLALETSRLRPTEEGAKQFLYEIWERPAVGSDERSWFNVTICSTRGRILDGSTSALGTQRFYLMLDNSGDVVVENPLYTNPDDGSNNMIIDDAWAPACLLVEQPEAGDTEHFGNVGIPWMDAGGPGDTVTIVVTFNHPLITPLGIAPYVRLQSRNSAVNEAFRTADVPLFNPPGDLGGEDVIIPTATDTPPPPPTPTYTDTPEASLTFTPTDTPTIEPFSCDKLHVKNVSFTGQRLFIEFKNDNEDPAWLVKSILLWNKNNLVADYPNINVSTKALDGEIYWLGQDYESPTDSSIDPDFFASAQLEVPGQGNVIRWEAVISNGPSSLGAVNPSTGQAYMQPWDFAGTTFYFYPLDFESYGPDMDAPGIPAGGCAKTLELPPTPPPPTETPEDFEPSPTHTPDCADTTFEIELVSFDTLGDVRIQVTNLRSVVAPFTAFNIVWREPAGYDIALQKVVVGGSNANDLPASGGSGVVVWQGNPVDDAPNTLSTDSNDGTWLTDFSFAPFTPTYIHLDFTGVGGATLSSVGLSASDFNGSWFEIGCGAPGGSGGSGSGDSESGRLFISDAPTPRPTTEPGPTNTFAPTATASDTYTPAPPTFTWTPAPPTLTFTPAPATATWTVTPFVLNTVPPSDSNE